MVSGFEWQKVLETAPTTLLAETETSTEKGKPFEKLTVAESSILLNDIPLLWEPSELHTQGDLPHNASYRSIDSIYLADTVQLVQTATPGPSGISAEAADLPATAITLPAEPDRSSKIQVETTESRSSGKPQAGTLLEGRYRLLKKIGSGGTAEVYLAEHVTLGNMWAVKILPVSDDALQEHLNEAGILKRLNHPMLPRISDIIQTASHVCIVMDYLLGVNLLERLEASGKIPEVEVRAWMLQICDVLAYLHGQQPEPVIYRDLKPSNLMSDDHGHLKLIDFGTARTYRATRNGDTAYIGTQGYASPEQYGLKQSDGRTDIYNLGMTVFHLLTGIHPITVPHGEIKTHLQDAFVSELLTSVIVRSVQLSPGNRYPDVQSCREALMAAEPDMAGKTALPAGKMVEPVLMQPLRQHQGIPFVKSRQILAGLLGTRKHQSSPERAPVPAQARIAVMGACQGTGATFSSIAISSWFSARHYQTAYVEMNASGDMDRLQKMLELSGNLMTVSEDADGRECFRFKRVDYHKCCRRMTDIRGKRYDVSIADMGARGGEPALDEFMRADWQLVYCPQADWKFGRMEEFIGKYDPDGDERQFLYLVPHDGDGDLPALRALLGKRSNFAFPHIRNPFDLAKAEDRQLEQLFRQMGFAL